MTSVKSNWESKLSDWISRVISLTSKDIRCELRTRYAINALAMFSFVTLVVVGLTVGQDLLSAPLHASLFWIVVLFSALQALSASFVKEEEAKTADTLRVYATPGIVYSGKLLFSLVLMGFLLVILIPLYLILMNLEVRSVVQFLVCAVLGSFGIAAATNIIAAIVSRASVKGALFAVLAFPLLLPIILSAVAATGLVLTGSVWGQVWVYLRILIAYPMIVVTLSYILFEYVWNE